MTRAAAVILVPPPCGSTAVWKRVLPLLDELGVTHIAVELPSGVAGSELTDVDYLRSVLDEHGEAVVLASHSSGCVPMTEVGSHPAVRHLVYIDGPLWDVDEPWNLVVNGGVAEGFGKCFRGRPGITEFDVEKLSAYLSSRGWPSEDVQEFVPGCVPHRHAAGTYKLTVAAWRTVDSTFVQPLDSEMKRHAQDVFAARATQVIQIEGDHFPHWRRPREIADVLAQVARESVD